MIYTYYIDVTQFEEEALFREKLNLLSPYRQQKIALLKHEKIRTGAWAQVLRWITHWRPMG